MLLPSASVRVIGEVKQGGKATQGDNSPIYESGTVEETETEALTIIVNLPEDIESCHEEIKRLAKELQACERDKQRLEGRYEERGRLLDIFIKSKQ